MKKELIGIRFAASPLTKKVAITSTVILVVIAVGVGTTTVGWDNVLYALNTLILCFAGFGIPIIIGAREYLESTDKSSSTENNDTRSNTESSQTYSFSSFPKIAKFLADHESSQFVEEYLVNVQAVELSNLFLLLNHIHKFQAITVKFQQDFSLTITGRHSACQ